MNAVSYVVAALAEPDLCLHAANSLRDICDANRVALAPHIAAFGQLHANVSNIPVSVLSVSPRLPLMFSQDMEKGKVLQSIASVIQALPPAEEIPPIEVGSV